MSSSICFLGASTATSLRYSAFSWPLTCSTTAWISDFGDPGALHAHGLGRAHGQEERVALAHQLFGAGLVEHHAGVGDRGGRERHAGGHVGLDQAGDDVDRRALGGQHQVDAGGTGQLGDAHDRVLDVARGDHHQVGELVDDDQKVRVGLQDPLGARGRHDLAVLHGLVEVVDVLEAEVGEVVVAGVHLLDHPLQRLGGLLGVGDDGGDQVRHALVGGELHALGVDHDHADLVGGGAHQDRGDHRVHEARLARAGGAGHQQVRHLGEVGDDEAALDVLADADDHRVVGLAGVVAAQHVAERPRFPGPRWGSRCRSRTCPGSGDRMRTSEEATA